MPDIFSGKRTIPHEKRIDGGADYFYLAHASRDTGKASLDLILRTGNEEDE